MGLPVHREAREELRWPKDEAYWATAEREIQAWESRKPGYLARAGDAVLWVPQKLLGLLIPRSAQEAVAKAIEGALRGTNDLAGKSFLNDHIQFRVDTLRDQHGDALKARDHAAREYWSWHVGYAFVEGGLTGAPGLPGLVADIPLLFSIVMRLINQVAACYGYDPADPLEKDYALHVLRTGGSSDIKAKMEFLVALKQVEQVLLKVTWKRMNASLAQRELSRLSALAAIRAFARSLGIQVTKRKSLQAVPVVGAVVGASFNATFVNDVGRAAYMSYRRRWMTQQSETTAP